MDRRRLKTLRWISALLLVPAMAACSEASENPVVEDPLAPIVSGEGGSGNSESGGDDVATDASTSTITTSTTTTLPPLVLGKGFSATPCVNGLPDLGCIRLGSITDETGNARFQAPAYFAGAQAFWATRNTDGGVADSYSVEVLRAHKRDAASDPTLFRQYVADIEPDVAGLSHIVGAGAAVANMDSLVNGALVSAPVDQWSGWSFLATDVGSVLESGGSWCAHGYNAVDPEGSTVGLVSDASLAGRDFAAGARVGAADAAGLVFDISVTPIATGGDAAQQEVVARILLDAPDTVLLATGPSEAGAIVGGAILAGYEGQFIMLEESFAPALLDPAGGVRSVLTSDQVKVIGSHGPWATEGPGQDAMRRGADALGVPPEAYRGFQVGWVAQFPILAAREGAIRAEELERRGIGSAAARGIEPDYEGIIPGDALSSIVMEIDPDAPDLFVAASEFFSVDGLADAYQQTCAEI